MDLVDCGCVSDVSAGEERQQGNTARQVCPLEAFATCLSVWEMDLDLGFTSFCFRTVTAADICDVFQKKQNYFL